MALPTNGNAGAALAAYAAAAGIEATVICPEETPPINIAEAEAYGARVLVADGQIDECGRLVGEGAAAGRWFDVSTLKEPYRAEGKKVMGLELAEQFGWELPDVIFYPTGGGTGLIGMWKAFAELEAVGLIGPEAPAHGRGAGDRLRADGPGVGSGRRVRRALGQSSDRRHRHPRAQGGRRFPDPARGAGKRRLRDRGRGGSRSPPNWRRRRARTGSCCAPKARRCWQAGALALERGLVGKRRKGGAVQLRGGQQISAASRPRRTSAWPTATERRSSRRSGRRTPVRRKISPPVQIVPPLAECATSQSGAFSQHGGEETGGRRRGP